MTQKEFAEAVGVTQGRITKFENGLPLTYDHLIKMLDKIGVDVSVICTLDGRTFRI